MSISDWDAADEVLPIALEKRMGQNRNEAVAVAGWPAAGARLAFAGDTHPHFVVDARGDLDLSDNFLEGLAAAAAGGARVFDDGAFTVAGGAGCLNADNAGRLDHPTLPAAIAANLTAATFSGPRSFALVTVLVAVKLDSLGDAGGGFLERERHIAANIAPLALSPSVAASEQVTKQVPESGKDVLHVSEVVRTELAVKSGVSKTIVTGALFWVVEHLESFGCLLEAIDSLLITGILVRMILYSQFTVGGRDIAIAGGTIDSEHFVEIALRHHSKV